MIIKVMKKRRTASKKSLKKAPKKKGASLSKSSARKAKAPQKKTASKQKKIIKKPASARKASLGTILVHKKAVTPVKKKPANLREHLPFSYGKTKIALLVRDPEWGYAYWDFSTETWEWIEKFYREQQGVQAKLRIHNIDQNSFHDLDIDLQAKNWYIQFGLVNTHFEAELGFIDASGKFYPIARSNRIKTPRSGPSERIDSAWNPADVGWDDIYRISGGGESTGQSSALNLSSPVKKRV